MFDLSSACVKVLVSVLSVEIYFKPCIVIDTGHDWAEVALYEA